MAKANYLPSNLSFSRGIELTEGIMSGIKAKSGFKGVESLFDSGDRSWERAPVEVTATTARGTIANYDVNSPASRVGADSKAINNANISRVERALLPADAALLLVEFQARFNDSGTRAHSHNSAAFIENVDKFIDAYRNGGGYTELATRYFLRLANGSWLWRNRFGDDMQIRLELDGSALVLLEGDLDIGSEGYTLKAVAESKRGRAKEMVERIAIALGGGPSATIKCAGLVAMGAGAEVYPSQEFSSESTQSVGGEKPTKILSRLYDIQQRPVATIHARKIGNAIRTIDTWHNVAGVGAIAIEMFGANTHQSVAHRISGNDFYTYFKDVEELAKQAEANEIDGRHHYVAACLIRGGVFGFGSSK